MTADTPSAGPLAAGRDPGYARLTGMVLAMLAAVWHAGLMTSATNDNFAHLTLARQWLAGDWPVRDFFDQGWVLQYTLSALALVIGGDRLASEAVVVGVAWGVSTYLVFRLVRQLAGSFWAAVLAAILLIVAGARGYSYPKGIVYAVAAALWWRYVNQPTRAAIIAFGAWAAAAFYWRPDHGLYLAVAIALAAVAAHGWRALAITRCAMAAATMLALLAPFFVYVQATVGLLPYARTGLAAAQVEHTTQGPHEWPLLRFGRSPFAIEPADDYAPVIAIRWRTDSQPADRQAVLARYGLSVVDSEDAVDRVRLSARTLDALRALVNEPIVEDTAGIDRSSARVLRSAWTTWQRWAFDHAWLRVQFLPWLDSQARATEVTVALFHALPVLVMAGAWWMAPHLAMGVTAPRLAAFAVFAALVDLAMLRVPFPARAADAVVPSAILSAVCLVCVWRTARARARPLRLLAISSVVVFAVALVVNVAAVGRFGARSADLAGEWTSLARARAAWRDVYAELVASPPLDYYVDEPARLSLRLAAYIRECVPPAERLLVLWFEPEIYYYSDRLMAQRHVVFAPAWSDLQYEQRMTLEKVTRAAPPIALARQSALEGYTRASYPMLVDYVEREYRPAAHVADGGEDYLIFSRRDRTPLRTFGAEAWPCFVQEASRWSRVGQPSP